LAIARLWGIFPKHLEVITTSFYFRKALLLDGVETFVSKVLNASDFDSQWGMFKLTMKLNATTCMAPSFNTNPLTRIWCLVITTQILIYNFLEIMKLVELAMVQIWLAWKMKGVFLHWLSSNQNSSIGSLPICLLLCTCLHQKITSSNLYGSTWHMTKYDFVTWHINCVHLFLRKII